MLLLIDGYNLLHQSDLIGRGRGERWLQRARERLLRQLQQHLDAPLASQTCIVFDAESPPPDRSHEYFLGGIWVLYAVGYPEADDLVEELIARHAAPQRLTVISSDHRLQRAARRRRAHAFDSDIWYQRLLETGPQLGIRWPPDAPLQRDQVPLPVPEKLEGLVSEREVEAWLQWFEQAESPRGDAGQRMNKTGPPPAPAARSDAGPAPRRPQPQPQPRPRPKTSGRPSQRSGSPDKQIDRSLENPFPEGYGEDLLDDES